MLIPIIYEHLFYKYIVRRSVSQATKGKNVNVNKRITTLKKSRLDKFGQTTKLCN